jgi:hypothetical protein
MAAAAWLRQGERIAQQIRTEPYNQAPPSAGHRGSSPQCSRY